MSSDAPALIPDLEQKIAAAITFLLNHDPLPPGELRRLVLERFGADADAELARRFERKTLR